MEELKRCVKLRRGLWGGFQGLVRWSTHPHPTYIHGEGVATDGPDLAWPGLSVSVCESRRPGFQLPQHPLLQILGGLCTKGCGIAEFISNPLSPDSESQWESVGGMGVSKFCFFSLYQEPFVFSNLFPKMSSREPQFPFKFPEPVLCLREVRLPWASAGAAAVLVTPTLGSQLSQ